MRLFLTTLLVLLVSFNYVEAAQETLVRTDTLSAGFTHGDVRSLMDSNTDAANNNFDELYLLDDKVTSFNTRIGDIVPQESDYSSFFLALAACTSTGQIPVWNQTTTSWACGSQTGGTTTFLELTDTPAAYAGYAGYYQIVNAGETGLEFVPAPTGTGDMTRATYDTDTDSKVDVAEAITADTGGNVTITLGDSAGVNKVTVVDSVGAEVASIDSNGAISGTTYNSLAPDGEWWFGGGGLNTVDPSTTVQAGDYGMAFYNSGTGYTLYRIDNGVLTTLLGTGANQAAPGNHTHSTYLESVVGGTGISVDNTDLQNPIITATGTAGGTDVFDKCFDLSDEDTPLTAGTNVRSFRMQRGMTIEEVRASLNSGAYDGDVIIDINENGTPIFSTPLTIDSYKQSHGAIVFAGTSGSIDAVTINGVTVTSASVPFNADLGTTVVDLASNITTYNSDPDYTAVGTGDTLLLTSSDYGNLSNGYAVAATTTTMTSTTDIMSGGQNAITTTTASTTPPVLSDTFLADDSLITVDIDQVGSTTAGTGAKVCLVGNTSPPANYTLTVTDPGNGDMIQWDTSGADPIDCGNGAVDCTTTQPDGTVISGITAVPASGREWTAWTGDITGASASAGTVTLAGADVYGSATFQVIGIDASDTFTDADGTLLTAHTSDSGHTWTEIAGVAGSFQINTNAVVSSGESAFTSYYSSLVPSSADYTVQADIYTISAGATSGAICARLGTVSRDGYCVSYASGDWVLRSVVGGVGTAIATYTGDDPIAAGGVTVKLIVTDAAKIVEINGVQRISSSDNTITAAGRPGIASYYTTISSTIDNWQVTQ